MIFAPAVSRPQVIDRATTATRVFAYLRDDIVALRRVPGSPLREKEVAAAFNVSRTPVREAILKLADERLVDIFPQRGTFIARINTAEVFDALFLRIAVESAAAATAAERSSREAAIHLGDNLRRHEEIAARTSMGTAFYQVDEEFHQALLDISGHPTIWRVVNNAKAHMDRVRRLALPDPGHFQHVLRGHRRIVEAVASGDGPAAAAAARDHLEPLRDILNRLAEKHPDYFDFTPPARQDDGEIP